MTETLVTTAEAELQSLVAWMDGHVRTGVAAAMQDEIRELVRKRLTEIQGSHDGWRYRCQSAEKKNEALIKELRAVRDELITVKYGDEPPDPAAYYAEGEADGR